MREEISEAVDRVEIEAERYELRVPGKYSFEHDRRGFVQTLGSGLLIAAAVSQADRPALAQRGRVARREELLSERFHFGQEGIVTLLTSKVEVGQGSRTQLAQAAAEELRIPLDRIRVVMADTGQCPDDGGTAGSRTTPSTVPRVRNAAAAIREILLQHAAQRLATEPGKIVIGDGVFVAGNGRQVTLAALAADAELAEKFKAPPPPAVAVAPVAQWRVLGSSVAKVDGREVVTGHAKYPSDIALPGMLFGKVLRPISYGAKLISIDLQPGKKFGNVTVVRDGDFIGCVAPTSWQAAKARDAVAGTAQWERPSHVDSSRLYEHLKSTARIGSTTKSGPSKNQNAVGTGQRTLDVAYTIAYVQHAPMEPRAAVAQWDSGALTVWTGSQQPARVQGELCQAFHIAPEKVRVIIPDTGGGFGGKHTGEVAVEAARLAKSAGRPVSLRWTREEEFTWAYFRPAGVIEIQSGLDASGNINTWNFINYNSGGSAIETPYQIPGAKSHFVETESPLRQGSYRALASTANTFARESCMDELAQLAGIDPLEFRLRHLPDGRLKDVLLAAADKFGWAAQRNRTRDGIGIGLACGTEKGSYVAACAEIEVQDREIRVRRVCQAYECGAIHNPRNLQSQVEGSVMMGLGGALFEAMEFAKGQIQNDNFSSYRVPRMSDLPVLEIVLLDRKDLPSVGGSETPIIAIAPAVANAVFDCLKTRVRSMPIQLI